MVEVLTLQLLFVVASLSVVTVLPAALALQTPQLTIPDADHRAVIDLAFGLLHRRLPQLAVAAFLIMGWSVVQLRLPTLTLIGSGLIQALITWLLVARTGAPFTAIQHRDGSQ